MIKIPKIIHQIWKDEQLPEAFQLLSQTWRDMLPDWEYRLWTDEMNRAFVRKHYSEFLAKYDAYSNTIQRADAIRFLFQRTYGGLYVDLDFECVGFKVYQFVRRCRFRCREGTTCSCETIWNGLYHLQCPDGIRTQSSFH